MSKSATWVCPSCNQELPVSEVMTHTVKVCPGSTAKQSKYRVTARAKRTDCDGIVYDSALEMRRAVELKAMKASGEITEYLYHVRVRLGDIVYETDFLVIQEVSVSEWDSLKPVYHVHFEDVKGMETREFKRVRKLWPKYSRIPLFVLKRIKDGGWSREMIGP